MAHDWRVGFNRLWVFVSVLWVALMVFFLLVGSDWRQAEFWRIFLHGETPGWVLLFVPPAILWVLMRGLAWVFAGFSRRSSN
jgi:hypothetical protein